MHDAGDTGRARAVTTTPRRAAVPSGDFDEGGIATLEDYAVLKFGDEGAEVEKALGSLAEWMQQAELDYRTFLLAARAVRKNEIETLTFVENVGAELVADFADGLTELSNRYKALAQVATAANVRAVAGLARLSVARDAMAEG